MSGQRRAIPVIVLVLLAVPLALAAIEAVSYYAANSSNGALVSSGRTRTYELHVPPAYDGTRPVPLVISLHGGAMWPVAQRETSQWNRVADQHGFIVVYPSAVEGDGPLAWELDRVGGPSPDVVFISDLIDTLSAAYNIDRRRIYADGLSNGAAMSFVLSCTLPDRVAAVGLVAAALMLPWERCQDDRPVPMIAFHGTDDPVTPYHGGKTFVAPRPFPDVPAFVARWARRNRCAGDAADHAVTADVSRRTYAGCADHADIDFYTVDGGGHTWPGGGPIPEWFAGPTTHSIDATGLMWDFFREHPLREAIAVGR